MFDSARILKTVDLEGLEDLLLPEAEGLVDFRF